jgi:hypothetical protein
MSDEIKRFHGLRDESDPEFDPDADAELTTADLAGRSKPGSIIGNAEPSPAGDAIVFAEVDSIEVREVPSVANRTAPLAGNANRSATRPTASYAVAGAAPAMEHETGPLFSSEEARNLRARWDAIQVGFVDEPRHSVQQADNLVAGTMKRLAEIFAEERGNLESQWDKGTNFSTEDLRLALRRYRSFFSRLLNV